jgi:hypothetical protein
LRETPHHPAKSVDYRPRIIVVSLCFLIDARNFEM